jgi:hypothetical protein
MTNPWTPGPWPIEYDNDTGHDDSGFSAWYLVGPARVDIGFGQTKIAAANARLISAAPCWPAGPGETQRERNV